MKYDFQALCLPHRQRLIQVAKKELSADYEKAEDVVQDVYIRALRYWPKWEVPSWWAKPEDAVLPWLYRITVNMARNYHNHRNYREGSHQVYEAEVSIETTGKKRGDEIRAQVSAALSQINPEFKQVLELFYFSEQPYDQIAETLGIPMGTVMSRMHRGKKALFRILSDFAREELGIWRV